MKLEIAAALHAIAIAFAAHPARGAPSPAHRRLDGRDVGTPRAVIASSLAPAVIDVTPIADEPPKAAKRKPPPPPLHPRAAAKRFVAWMQAMGLEGERPWRDGPRGACDGIWECYLWHCDEEGLQPVPDNMFGQALGALIKRRQVRDRKSGKLERLTYYTIPPMAEPVQAAARPMVATRAPRRRAA